jgi:hypothetical protein
MKFRIPRGQSLICHFEVYPVPPSDGQAQPWRVVNTSERPRKEVERFDISFRKRSTPSERQSERMIMVFTIADKSQTSAESWRFVHGGVMYCEGKADYRDDLSFSMSADGTVLTATARALSDGDEEFQFSFLAMRRDNVSGECRVYSSQDPGGKISRDN